jgi:dTDP-glucose pyrophosphorylase
MVLGDCICNGEFIFPKDMQQGIGVWETQNIQDIKQSYAVEIKDNFVSKVIEKPKKIINNLCGMGFYFFDKRVFGYIKLTPPSPIRGEIEITDVIQKMIDAGEKISPVLFKGKYLNITYPQDLKRAEAILTTCKS